MYSINMNKQTIHITSDMTQMTALKKITKEYRENPGFLMIDLSDASFLLSRDFFLVLSQRLPTDIYRLILSSKTTAVIAGSLGIETELA